MKKNKHSLRATAGVLAAGLVVALSPLPTFAHQSPGGCNANRLNLSIMKDKTSVMIGDTITYTVSVTNIDSGADIACDITNATVNVTLPAPDGTPTGTVVNLATGVDYPAGTITTIVGTAQYVVATDPGVEDMVAQAEISGTLHDAPVDHSAQIIKTLGTTVVATPDPPIEPPDQPQNDTPTSYPSALPRTGR